MKPNEKPPENHHRVSRLRSPVGSAQILQLAGVFVTLIVWQLVISSRALGEGLSDAFSPIDSFKSLYRLTVNGELIHQVLPSLKRILVGLTVATAIGFFFGIVLGLNRSLERFTYTTFQFLRMISPLAWMPIAIILLGIGDKPIYFLLVIAAVWPVMMETQMGVRGVNPLWVSVVRTLGGSKWQVLRKVVMPAVIPHILTGLKLAVGISWIILVPAEMLGVSSGLGYYILDCRDRFSYDEMMAIIMVIGLMGLLFDAVIGALLAKMSWSNSE